MPNTVWSIAFGDYDFAIDRKTLRVRLADTKTGVVWADAISSGWVELEDRDGAKTRHDFADARLVSLSEKSGAQGKRVLFGLDLRGIPIDLYFTCAAREIQLTAEASRDTKDFRVSEICLLPGLVSVPNDGASYLVFPHGEGAILFARDAPPEPRPLQIWDAVQGVTMPFIGAVRGAGDNRSALGLITDSAYGAFHLQKSENGGATLDTHYTRDPERRRLDIRLVVLPGGDHISIARAYRDKIVGERGHITLRKKIRDRPGSEKIIGAAFWASRSSQAHPLLEAELSQAVFLMDSAEAAEGKPIGTNLAGELLEDNPSRWDDMETRLETLAQLKKKHPLVGSLGGADWSAVAVDYWTGLLYRDHWPEAIPVPLYAAVYHDSVVAPAALRADWTPRFLRGLLNLSPPCFWGAHNDLKQWVYGIHTVLCPLHTLCFAAFLTSHRFLTPDFKVEEALYSNGARVVINQSRTDTYETNEFVLPPLGFYARHAQMEAHDALRVDNETFEGRAYRIQRVRDEKPLGESADISREIFPVEPV